MSNLIPLSGGAPEVGHTVVRPNKNHDVVLHPFEKLSKRRSLVSTSEWGAEYQLYHPIFTDRIGNVTNCRVLASAIYHLRYFWVFRPVCGKKGNKINYVVAERMDQ